MSKNWLWTLVGATALSAAAPAQAATEIQWWHAMSGPLGKKVVEIADDFNASQNDYKVVPVYKGNYSETMTAAIAAFRAGEQPDIVQVFEVGTATMMAAKGAIKPVHELMAEAGEPFDPDAYLPAVKSYYTTSDGKMLSMPFNSSTPVLYYNKEAARLAGLNPDKAPETWEAVEEFGRKAQKAGYSCGITTGWQSWTQLENFSAWHNVPFATRANGFDGLDTELVFNGPLQKKHIATLGEWQKTRLFDYGGRRSDARAKFTSGECAMYIDSSASLAGVRRAVKTFQFGVGTLPYWADAKGAPQNSIIGGATLWALAGHDADHYKGVAKFFTYLSSPEVQLDWHLFTGYLPVTKGAYELGKKRGVYADDPAREVGIRQMMLNAPTENSRGLRLGNFVQIRDIINEELENVWSGNKSADQALDDAVARGNKLLRRFEKSVE